MKTILFYGPLWFKNKKRIGGSESGNKRTIQILIKCGFNMVLLNKPYAYTGALKLIYPIRLIVTYLKFVRNFFAHKPDSIHLTGYYFTLIYTECVFILTSKLFNVRSIYEIRAGGAEIAYHNGSRLYRYVFRLVIRHCSVVLCQGKESINFIKSITQKNALYYPNYVMNDQYLPYNLNKRDSSEIVELVYFGRIVPAKNIEFIIEIAHYLQKAGIKYNLEIIGDSNGDHAYLDRLNVLIHRYKVSNQVQITGAINTENLFSLLLSKHFFVFPTIESREGHSNSLTEAMSRGVVPIVNDIGFNKSIVDNAKLVIKTLDPVLYADTISSLWNAGMWKEISKNCYNIIGNSFTESAVSTTLQRAHVAGYSPSDN